MNVLVIFCSDIHLTETAPLARSAEPDWMDAQNRMLEQLHALVDKYECPICGGTILGKKTKGSYV